jgi:hypothetical protein
MVDVLPFVEAAPENAEALRGCLLRRNPRQRGLADSRLAADGHDLAAAGGSLVAKIRKKGQLLGPPDEQPPMRAASLAAIRFGLSPGTHGQRTSGKEDRT